MKWSGKQYDAPPEPDFGGGNGSDEGQGRGDGLGARGGEHGTGAGPSFGWDQFDV